MRCDEIMHTKFGMQYQAHSRCSVTWRHVFQSSNSDSRAGQGCCSSWSHIYLPTLQNPSVQLLFFFFFFFSS